jgi:hypothetical protein
MKTFRDLSKGSVLSTPGLYKKDFGCNLFADFQSLTDISPSIRTASTTRAARTFIVPTFEVD